MPAIKLHAKGVFLATVLLVCQLSFGQKKKISEEAYDRWNRIENSEISAKGAIVIWESNPIEGDGVLHVAHKKWDDARLFPRGKSAAIHSGEFYMAFLIKPEHDTIRKLKLDKVKKDKFPKDTLVIHSFETDSTVFIPEVESFKVAKEGDWMAYLSTEDLRPQTKKKKKKKKKKKGAEQIKTSGQTLILFNPLTNNIKKIHRVKKYTFNRSGTLLAYTTSEKGESDSLSAHIINLSDMSMTTLSEKLLSVEKLTFDYSGEQLFYFSSSDTNKTKNYELSYWKKGDANSKVIADSTTKGMPLKYGPSKNGSAYFSRNGKMIFFGTSELSYPEEEDTLLDSEKAKVDIWASEDLRIQPEQLKAVKRDKIKPYTAVYHVADKKFLQLARPDMESINTYDHANANFAIGRDTKPYEREKTWAFPWKSDYYWVDVKNGKRYLIKSGLAHATSISPSGKYFVWYAGEDSVWYSKDMISKEERNISEHLNIHFSRDANGMPYVPNAESYSGWIMLDGDEYLVTRDKWDIWLIHPHNTQKTFSLTNGEGRKSKMRYYLVRTEYDSTYLSLDNAMIRGVDDLTKDESIYSIELTEGKGKMTKLLESNHTILAFSKAKESDDIIFRRGNFIEYPEIERSDLTLKETKVISNTNPQQEEYNWATVEFVEWQAYDSTELRGLLYKPEDFDPNKKYPMIVYFYELYQDNFHRYYAPKPTASIIYPTEYASNGYIVFIPDVRYEPGHPAKGAYNCIVSGTEYLVDKYEWIDSTRLGLQGQSWGGYQTAQLITMTTKYRAAMAGAPVSNMFSAYGGIRWGSGLSRMFQYERYQSRIGYTIWERPDLYIENSPIFGLPNVETPVLIMHNDNDGAVPWYQGIEMYMGLRRLDKAVWMLNYNNDEHNLRKLPNKRDLSKRMRQFFDHYLLDAPMPSWMKNGLPAVDKGIENGFELEK
jgi:dipeptidyl aminopeptidase/acylaminoacyl peptidase